MSICYDSLFQSKVPMIVGKNVIIRMLEYISYLYVRFVVFASYLLSNAMSVYPIFIRDRNKDIYI